MKQFFIRSRFVKCVFEDFYFFGITEKVNGTGTILEKVLANPKFF